VGTVAVAAVTGGGSGISGCERGTTAAAAAPAFAAAAAALVDGGQSAAPSPASLLAADARGERGVLGGALCASASADSASTAEGGAAAVTQSSAAAGTPARSCAAAGAPGGNAVPSHSVGCTAAERTFTTAPTAAGGGCAEVGRRCAAAVAGNRADVKSGVRGATAWRPARSPLPLQSGPTAVRARHRRVPHCRQQRGGRLDLVGAAGAPAAANGASTANSLCLLRVIAESGAYSASGHTALAIGQRLSLLHVGGGRSRRRSSTQVGYVRYYSAAATVLALVLSSCQLSCCQAASCKRRGQRRTRCPHLTVVNTH